MSLSNKRRYLLSGLLVSAVLIFGTVTWFLREAESVPERESDSLPRVPPPPAVYVAPDVHPRTSVKGTTDSVSELPLRLQLFATSPGHTSKEGTALLGTDPNNPQTYGAGSVLASGAVIDEIHHDFIVLVKAGQLSRLYRVGFVAPDDKALVAATTVGGPGISDRPISKHASSQPDYVEVVRPKLVFEGEKLTGFEIGAGRMRHLLSTLGLEPGDIIR